MKAFTLNSAAFLVYIVKNNPRFLKGVQGEISKYKLGPLLSALVRRGYIEYDTEIRVTELGMEKYQEIQQMKIWE